MRLPLAAYARSCGVNQNTVRHAWKQGMVERAADGTVDEDQADESWYIQHRARLAKAGYQKVLAVGVALVALASLFATRSNAQDQLLKLSGGIPAGVCNSPMRIQVTGGYVICLVPTSVCLAHGGHIGLDPRDSSGSPHCMESDLVPLSTAL
jgi:hypothetical protein